MKGMPYTNMAHDTELQVSNVVTYGSPCIHRTLVQIFHITWQSKKVTGGELCIKAKQNG
jgi:hypothetical protein